MSVLQTPRLYFIGKCTWDPIVTNNDNNYWNIETSKPEPPLVDADAYRAEVAGQIASHGNWNVDGTHRSVFYETKVTGVDLGQGVSVDDPLVGVPVGFKGMLVDINPYIGSTSQLFYDEMKVGIDGGPQVVLPNNGPIVARHIGFRNPSLEIAGRASVIWQGSTVEGLSIAEHDSPVLVALQEQIGAGNADGLTVRFNAYRTIYFNNDQPPSSPQMYQDLQSRVQGGGFQPNPARSWIVGVVGLHVAGEPASMPGDRPLSGSLGNTAFARVDGNRLDIDMGNTVRETDVQANKQDLGPLTVSVGGSPVTTLSFADYDKAAYDKTSGIVTVSLTADQATAAQTQDLSISNGTVSLEEEVLTTVVDPPMLYFEGVDSKEVTVQVLRRGVPVTSAVNVQVAEVSRNSGAKTPTNMVPALLHLSVTTDTTGKAVVRFGTDDASEAKLHDGSSQWVFTPYEGAEPSVPSSLNPDTDCYVATRVTPADATIAAMSPTWDNVHTQVLRDWEALAPCMDNWLRLGDESSVRAIAGLVKKLTSIDNFDSFDYMPVTRGMSAGQRTLLHNWCDNPAPSTDSPFALDDPKVDASDLTNAEVDFSRGAG